MDNMSPLLTQWAKLIKIKILFQKIYKILVKIMELKK